jgi:hypothetical protein
MFPVVNGLKQTYGQQIDFLHFDIDNGNTKALQEQLRYTGLRPTIIFFDAAGQEQLRMFGIQNADTIRQALDSLLAVGG